MLSGILDKNQYGATQYSLIHVFFELYGGTYSGKLLSAFSKIFTNFLHTEGFTLGVRDILVKTDANEKRYSKRNLVHIFDPFSHSTLKPWPLKKGTFDTNAMINSEGSGDIPSTQNNRI